MQIDVTPLFQPFTLNKTQFPNRIVMPSMRTMRDLISEEGMDWYGRRARGGAGCVIVEGVAIQSFGPELTAKNMQPLVDRIHDGGAVAAIQLIPVPLDQQRTDPADLTKHAITSLLRQYQRAAETCRRRRS
jgi:2,4-dienoyl-CoA reductase-like NADH-dependent reductase (Old Yellow Enzyme family)